MNACSAEDIIRLISQMFASVYVSIYAWMCKCVCKCILKSASYEEVSYNNKIQYSQNTNAELKYLFI